MTTRQELINDAIDRKCSSSWCSCRVEDFVDLVLNTAISEIDELRRPNPELESDKVRNVALHKALHCGP